MSPSFSSADLETVRRVELASAAIGRKWAAHTSGASVLEVTGGGVAVVGGADSPLTHALALGMAGTVLETELVEMERFFNSHGSACAIDLCALADASIHEFVRSRPYRLLELNYVLVRRIEPPASGAQEPGALRIDAGAEAGLWSRVVAHGFSGEPVPPPEFMDMLLAAGGSVERYLARLAGEPAGGAALSASGRVAWFFGDATIPAARGAGVQSALIRRRIEAAAAEGCDLAAASVLPASGSHRNYLRAGFEFLYTLANLRRDLS
jgi:hypothetical protein